ncbi:outer membrane beta-barrel protein [Sphingomonas aurantiaca]|uniref:Outer membrane immunogenic protein n=1 Tax=Sphingomonas aurantiaca TaxID=185949 RepID=A0A2T5GTN6_9SPHN|nr:outer membrane beta-barrel protein [Sphingomonas aurantiaca]PTQ62687.1 outer membrane immunogenic protein [Sphingomonas aurantiaca]
MNKTMMVALIGTAALGFAATPAAAQEMADDAAPFSGIYVGAAGGYDVQPNDVGSSIQFDRNLDGRFGDAVTTATGANAFSPGFCNGAATSSTAPAVGGRGCRNDKNNTAYYARVGIDQQMGKIVVGVVGEFGKSNIRDSVTAFSTTPAFYTMTRDLDWEASIRGRAGYAVNTTLFYGTFGAGYARINRDFYSSNTANAYAQSGKKNQFGITGGGGIEQKLAKNVSVGLEYMFHQYQDDDYRVLVTRGTQPATNPFVLAPNTAGTAFKRSDDNFRWHSVRGTVAFRF